MPPLRPAAFFWAVVPPWLELGRELPLPDFLPPRLEAPGELAILAASSWIPREDYPERFARFGIEQVPTLVVIEGKTVRGRLETPRSCREIERFLKPWLK